MWLEIVIKIVLPISLKATNDSFKTYVKHVTVFDVFQKDPVVPFCEIDHILCVAEIYCGYKK